MMWFSARVLFKAISQREPSEEMIYEETIVLLECPDEEKAKEESIKVALGMEHHYKNVQGQSVRWQLQRGIEVQEILDPVITHGTEVSSRFLDEPEVPSSCDEPHFFHSA